MDEHQQGDITIKSDGEYFDIDAGIPRPSKADLDLRKKNTNTTTPTPTTVGKSTKNKKLRIIQPEHVQAFMKARERTLLVDF